MIPLGWLCRDVRGSLSIAFSLAVSHVLVVKMMSGFRAQYLRHQCCFFPLSMWCLISEVPIHVASLSSMQVRISYMLVQGSKRRKMEVAGPLNAWAQKSPGYRFLHILLIRILQILLQVNRDKQKHSLTGRVECVYRKMGLSGTVFGDIHGLQCELRQLLWYVLRILACLPKNFIFHRDFYACGNNKS